MLVILNESEPLVRTIVKEVVCYDVEVKVSTESVNWREVPLSDDEKMTKDCVSEVGV